MESNLLLIYSIQEGNSTQAIEEKLGIKLRNVGRLYMPDILYAVLGEEICNKTNKWTILPESCVVTDSGIRVFRSGVKNCGNDPQFISAESAADLHRNGPMAAIRLDSEGLSVVNDFLGLYKVYYYVLNDTVTVCNSLKTLKSIFDLVIDQQSVEEYMSLGHLYSQNTLFKGIKCLPPCSILKVSNDGKLIVHCYDSFADSHEVKPTDRLYEEELHSILKDSISHIYSSNLVYSLSMTGGMDSRLIYLNWPSKGVLLTETAGDGTSDFLKAREIVSRLGNPDLHVLEDLKEESWTSGFAAYYDHCDNPLKAFDQFNYNHLLWKVSRRSDIHLSGVGGELLDGENLYMSRKPSYIVREALSGYAYTPLHLADKAALIGNIVGCRPDITQDRYLDFSEVFSPREALENVVSLFNPYLGKTKYAECYVERFRTYMLAVAGYNMSGLLNLGTYFNVMPFNDKKLIQAIVRYHPSTRELRKLAITLLRKDSLIKDIPTDTTHLPVSYPYKVQRFFRALRMVANIGFQKKIPILQKGEAPKFRAFPYFLPENADFRAYMREEISKASVFDKTKVTRFLNDIEKIGSYNFYVKHGAEGTLLKLYRLAIALKQ